MKVMVCIKRMPDTEGGVKFNPDSALDGNAMLAITDPDDKAELGAALKLKDRYGAEITTITMGLPKTDKVLREALAVGADRGILVTDRALEGTDTWAISSTLAGGFRKLGYNLIITERQAIDRDTAQVGPQISGHLDIPVIFYTQNMRIEGDYVVVERQFEDRYHVLRAKMPCLTTALPELNQPWYMTPGGIFHACEAKITVWGRQDLKDVDNRNTRPKGSSTQITRTLGKVRKGTGEEVKLDAGKSAFYLICKLTEKHIISYRGKSGG